MSTMHFMPNLTEFLRNNGMIYTIREYKYSTGESFVPSIGKVKRIQELELEIENLKLQLRTSCN